MREARPKPFAFVTALLGAVLVALSVYLAVATPRPSRLPRWEPGHAAGAVPCEALPRWIERTRVQGYTSRIHVRGGLAQRRRDLQWFLTCGEQRWRLDRAGALENGPDGVLVRITPAGRLVTPRPGHLMSPRANASGRHGLGMAFGGLGWLLLLLAWTSRPFAPLRDLVPRAPRVGVVLEPSSNDRLRWRPARSPEARGGELARPSIVADGDALRPGRADDTPRIALPGATEGYRDAAGGPPFVVGPAEVEGVRVASGERTPLAHGDRVRLNGAGPFVVALPTPGRTLRYLAPDGRLRLTRRVRDLRAAGWLLGALALAAGTTVALHVDLAWWMALAAPLGVATVLVARRIPARLARPVVTERDLDDLRAGRFSLTVVDEGDAGRSVRIDGAPAGRLPEPHEPAPGDFREPLADRIETELAWLLAMRPDATP
ncbi:MAG TPA: hypothetical protein RMH99_13870 [Sandaracinaceae bacterium LLY-WYZ-13_1]|nr:hypothetical protein [Sandaracinaceae bacterium LLY-WYZ-13_1]